MVVTITQLFTAPPPLIAQAARPTSTMKPAGTRSFSCATRQSAADVDEWVTLFSMAPIIIVRNFTAKSAKRSSPKLRYTTDKLKHHVLESYRYLQRDVFQVKRTSPAGRSTAQPIPVAVYFGNVPPRQVGNLKCCLHE